MKRVYFDKVEEMLLYLFGLTLFINEKFMSNIPIFMVMFLILRRVIYKEKLDCGSEKLKKFIIYFVVLGVVWNFLGGMSYRPARAFLKMGRYIPLIFFVYPMLKRDQKIFRNFVIVSLLGYLYLFRVVVLQYLAHIYRADGLSDINTTGLIGGIVASLAGAMAIPEKNIFKKIGYTIIFLSGLFITIATKGRGPMLSILLSLIASVGLHIYIKTELKEFAKVLSVILIGSLLFFKAVPQDKLDRFKDMFRTEKTYDNISNALRVEMWKNAIWRIKQKPILGSGTKYDRDNLFQKYVEQMPENTDLERFYKNIFKSGFDDAHSMYLNAAVDNGIFIFYLFGIWFGIPGYFILKHLRKIQNKGLVISLISGIISFEVQGLVWPIWRKHNQSFFWILLSFLIFYILYEGQESRRSK